MLLYPLNYFNIKISKNGSSSKSGKLWVAEELFGQGFFGSVPSSVGGINFVVSISGE